MLAAAAESRRALLLATISFLVSFAAWGLIGGLAPIFTQLYSLTASQTALLVAIPVAMICFFIVATPIAGALTVTPTWWQPVVKHLLYAVVAILLVAPPALGDGGWYARLTGSRPAVWLGEISYEVFLLHVIVMWVTMGFVLGWRPFTGSMTVLTLATLVITVPLAWWLRRLTRRKARSANHIDLSRGPFGPTTARDEPGLATSRR